MPSALTAVSLPQEITKLLQLNDYTVDGPLNIHGAEVDLRAVTHRSLFSETLYIEATVERVDVTKFGKDLTKLAMIAKQDPHAHCLVVSTQGFTRDVRERALVLGIKCMTFDELRTQFERFSPYIDFVLKSGPGATDLHALQTAYEEPKLRNERGRHPALSTLGDWLKKDRKHKWLVVLGEYGTGKTALTKILQLRWINEHLRDIASPIPFRIELRGFPKQFDSDTLLLYFMEHNHLSHLTLAYVKSLVRENRVVLLLDGYDEMAQYMNVRERRACLQALAELSNEGARGIITSRPNYFTEAEELEIMEYLYLDAAQADGEIAEARDFVASEQAVDALLESQFLERYEQTLEDLSTEQSIALVRRKLASNAKGQKTVVGLLSRVFRETGSDTRSLSGKPVIVWYLLEVVDELTAAESAGAPLSEWQIYSLIIKKLMYRDLKVRGPEVTPDQRRSFLRVLAEYLSKRENPAVSEIDFEALVAQNWARPVHLAGDDYRAALEQRVVNLRSSTTLTRADSGEGLQFSHNSLREFLLCEQLLESRDARGKSPPWNIPVSDAMRIFVASRTAADIDRFVQHLRSRWHFEPNSCSVWLNLLWDGTWFKMPTGSRRATSTLEALTGSGHTLRETRLAQIVLSSEKEPQDLTSVAFSDCEFLNVAINHADLRRAQFHDCWLDGVSLNHCDLRDSSITGILSDVSVTGANLAGADLRNIDSDSTIFVDLEGERVRLRGFAAVGYLRRCGAQTKDVPARYVFMHHYPRFQIMEKIIRKLSEQGGRQRLGLAHKGISQQDPQFAEAFIDFLLNQQFATESKAQIVTLTPEGRAFAVDFLRDDPSLPDAFEKFLSLYL
jgi:hypothetical protein